MSPETQLQSFIEKFTPEIAGLTNIALGQLQELLPSAVILVYDNYNALAIGFGPNERASDAIFSIAVYPKKINLNFLQGGVTPLNDPKNLLQGSGKVNRFITIKDPDTLKKPDVLALISDALAKASVPISRHEPGYLVIKSISEKQRPRRPG